MGGWDPDLRNQQHHGQRDHPDGHAITHGALDGRASTDGVQSAALARWRPLLVAVAAVVTGIALAQLSPIPGVGLILVIGAMMAGPVVVLRAWMGE